ncbi:hypothetical protein [Priestia endophytica]|uniref:hypothetical protein n=1 Tax=Priestia endophytica TaxID=135735 RepID=UPI000DCA6E61|nr:hypothetical protein [Priestia endophytica]RAS82590.1 hypothetical protein A4R27_08820 [Priestia endophytica]
MVSSEMERIEKEIKQSEQQINKKIKEVEKIKEENPAPQATALHWSYKGEEGYVEYQQKKQEELKSKLLNLQEWKEILNIEEKRGYKGKDMEVLEGMVRRRQELLD